MPPQSRLGGPPSSSLTVFSGNSLFSLLLLRPLVANGLVSNVVFSRASFSSANKVFNLYSKMSAPYFFYRSFISLISSFRCFSCASFCAKHGIPFVYVGSKDELCSLDFADSSIGMALNFDMIIPQYLLNHFSEGILNVHASDLPLDRGISPVVWAFSRGDNSIVSTVYRMDSGIDSGQIISKARFDIDHNWSLFKLYCHVLLGSGLMLSSILEDFRNGLPFSSFSHHNYVSSSKPTYNSWPNDELHALLIKNRRSYMKFTDFFYLARLARSFAH